MKKARTLGIVLYDFKGVDNEKELSVQEGEELYIVKKEFDWTYSERKSNGEKGYVPTLYINFLNHIEILKDGWNNSNLYDYEKSASSSFNYFKYCFSILSTRKIDAICTSEKFCFFSSQHELFVVSLKHQKLIRRSFFGRVYRIIFFRNLDDENVVEYVGIVQELRSSTKDIAKLSVHFSDRNQGTDFSFDVTTSIISTNCFCSEEYRPLSIMTRKRNAIVFMRKEVRARGIHNKPKALVIHFDPLPQKQKIKGTEERKTNKEYEFDAHSYAPREVENCINVEILDRTSDIVYQDFPSSNHTNKLVLQLSIFPTDEETGLPIFNSEKWRQEIRENDHENTKHGNFMLRRFVVRKFLVWLCPCPVGKFHKVHVMMRLIQKRGCALLSCHHNYSSSIFVVDLMNRERGLMSVGKTVVTHRLGYKYLSVFSPVSERFLWIMKPFSFVSNTCHSARIVMRSLCRKDYNFSYFSCWEKAFNLEQLFVDFGDGIFVTPKHMSNYKDEGKMNCNRIAIWKDNTCVDDMIGERIEYLLMMCCCDDGDGDDDEVEILDPYIIRFIDREFFIPGRVYLFL